jgi:hypothetical protein
VRFHGVARAGGSGYGRAHDDVVCEHEVCGQVLAEDAGIGLDVTPSFVGGQVLDEACLEPLVAVEDERRQHAADVGPDERRPGEVEALRVRLLAEDDDVVPLARPFARERARVDVRARPAEQVAVPEEDSHSVWCLKRAGRARVVGVAGR